MASRFSLGKQIDLHVVEADPGHQCEKEGVYTHQAAADCFWCRRDEISARIDATAATAIVQDCDPIIDRREVFLDRRRGTHVWVIITIILSLVVAMKSPDWPDVPLPNAPRCTPSSVR